MPYTAEQLKSKNNQFYTNVNDGDKQRQKELAEDAFKRMQISGSALDAVTPIRNGEGVLQSFEDPDNLGNSIEAPHQNIRLLVNQRVSTQELVIKKFGNDLQFLEIFPNEVDDIDDELEAEGIDEADTVVLQEALAEQEAATEELNQSLTDTINRLNKTIADLTDQAAQDAKPPKKKSLGKKILDRIKPSGTVKAVKKAVKKVGKTLKKLFSDERLKRDIIPVGIENGFNTYEFRYIWGTQRYKGVMAQEVMKTNPQAVDKLFGLYRVDYDDINVRFEKCQ